MKLNTSISKIKTVNELDFYWQNGDYLNLLEAFEFSDIDQISDGEILDYLFMSITDYEPSESAETVLNYKLKDRLSEGQIKNLSHEMLEDKVAEEYADPAFHFDLFNINQLLYKAYNGKFPNTEATILTINYPDGIKAEVTNEILLKSICHGLKDNHLIHRIFKDEIEAEVPFRDAEKVIWHFRRLDDQNFEVITSNYWIEDEDFKEMDYEAEIKFYEEDK